MDGYSNGMAYLEALKKENRQAAGSFSAYLDFLEQKARSLGVPISGQFELTPLCNFDCGMCYVHLSAEQLKGRKTLSVAQWKSVMAEAVKAGMITATLTGGECLTYPGFEELYLYLQSLGCAVIVLSNGALLDARRAAFFAGHMPQKVQITLYGSSEDAYERVTGRRAFGVVRENIQRLIDMRIPLEIAITPNRFLGEDVSETVRMAHSLGVPYFVNTGLFDPDPDTGRAGQDSDADTEQYIRIRRLAMELQGRKIREIPETELPATGSACGECNGRGVLCGAARSCFTVGWQGDMVPCNRLNMIKARPLETGFERAWQEIHRWAEEWQRIPECTACAYKEVCAICAGKWMRFTRPEQQLAEFCERTKHFVSRGICQMPECE